MKSLSVWNPWATWIALGMKRYETRPRRFYHHGPLLICSAKHRTRVIEVRDIYRIIEPKLTWTEVGMDLDAMEYGKALCIVDLIACVPAGVCEFDADFREAERAIGDYRDGRFALALKNVRRFKEPWPIRGRQGLFNIPDEEIAKHELEEV